MLGDVPQPETPIPKQTVAVRRTKAQEQTQMQALAQLQRWTKLR
jgi:hypothetical protein